MKQLILIAILVPFLFTSCVKKSKKYKYRSYGYLYNSTDSLPFINTQFKVFNYDHASYTKHETFFTTNDKGFFDVTSDFGGVLAWPSYIEGAAYAGPPYFNIPNAYSIDEVNKIYITNCDTLYTTPYH